MSPVLRRWRWLESLFLVEGEAMVSWFGGLEVGKDGKEKREKG